MQPGTLNRLPYPNPPWDIRGDDVKWPTLRGVWLDDSNIPRLHEAAITLGKSIIFLEGTYRTNLNQYTKRSPIERAVFFEWFFRSPSPHRGGIFFLCWIGNFHNGCIFHCAPQWPQVQAWEDKLSREWLDKRACRIYRRVTHTLYPGDITDPDVNTFVSHISRTGMI